MPQGSAPGVKNDVRLLKIFLKTNISDAISSLFGFLLGRGIYQVRQMIDLPFNFTRSGDNAS
jgi:hypothetical protein